MKIIVVYKYPIHIAQRIQIYTLPFLVILQLIRIHLNS